MALGLFWKHVKHERINYDKCDLMTIDLSDDEANVFYNIFFAAKEQTFPLNILVTPYTIQSLEKRTIIKRVAG